VILAAAGCFWLLGGAWGFTTLWRYESTPGAQTSAGERWPSGSRLDRKPDRFTLVLAVHPQCPCTRATIDSLAHVMERLRGRMAAYVLVYKPADAPAGWEKTDIWRGAAAIPGVTVLADVDGMESELFQAQTSGLANLYDSGGSLVFTGGLTAARGRSGISTGQQQLISRVMSGGGGAVAKVVKVFGCALRETAQLSE
jgi:hypothetical protein